MALGLYSQGVDANERAGLGERLSALLPGCECLGEDIAGRAQGRPIGGELGPADEALAGPALMTTVEAAATATDNAAAAATKTFFMGSSRRVVAMSCEAPRL